MVKDEEKKEKQPPFVDFGKEAVDKSDEQEQFDISTENNEKVDVDEKLKKAEHPPSRQVTDANDEEFISTGVLSNPSDNMTTDDVNVNSEMFVLFNENEPDSI
ncbi:uncharacterized protein MONOS_13703 [Monocercomonoides exilis]|uniref:uncharacterized protein n=1 Tax=Monocercomonoides exilis TaxID=2049356 RepID=UPI00355A894C|nr:hypothetical protein MONOS_13703 [Monocercomonoides exilis]|eukprot:MONOS_13703.1-p1 / transcript=MONOS_13703.1 / gene=MONOS_13703 / organism=Monocercomonoides_exilis_PA203 / gene_product=unspecified product / transcript_product=unspecified product / location=Mono_scaffold00868:4114-4422(-) / protein_length=103 / sequence_SO=supercontig / SO=protein_coding / is_pseudo=false